MRTALRNAALAGLLLATAVAYAPGLHADFVFDDSLTVETNLGIRNLGNFLRPDFWTKALRSVRVVTDFTFALNYAAGTLDPFPYHATNLAIHLAVVLLACAFTRKVIALSGSSQLDPLSFAVVALFALHPLQTQAVEYVSQRSELLASGFYLGSLMLLLAAERRRLRWTGLAWYLVGFAAFVLALAAKVNAMTLPFAYLLMGMLPSRAAFPNKLAPSRRRVALAAPLFVYAVVVVLRTLPTMRSPDDGLDTAGFNVPSLPAGRYFLTQWHVLVTYLRLIFWPAGQNLDWDFPFARGLGDPTVLLCGLLLAGLLLGAAYLFRRCRSRDDQAAATGRTAAFGVVWFYLVISPTSSIVPLADVVMEHRLYLPCWGIFLAVMVGPGYTLGRLASPRANRLAATLLLLLCGWLATLTSARVSLWRSKITLWSDVVAKSPRKARAHLGLGDSYRASGQTQRALNELTTALKLAGDAPAWTRARIYERLGGLYLSQGRTEDSIAAVQAGLAVRPEHSGLLGTLAMARLQRDELALAEEAAEKSVATSKRPAGSLLVLGIVRARMGNWQGASAAFAEAVKEDPDLLQARLGLAELYRVQGRGEQACDVLHAGHQPRDPTVRAQWQAAMAGCPDR